MQKTQPSWASTSSREAHFHSWEFQLTNWPTRMLISKRFGDGGPPKFTSGYARRNRRSAGFGCWKSRSSPAYFVLWSIIRPCLWRSMVSARTTHVAQFGNWLEQRVVAIVDLSMSSGAKLD